MIRMMEIKNAQKYQCLRGFRAPYPKALPRPRRTRTIDEQPCADQGDREREHKLKRKFCGKHFSHSSAFVETINGCLKV
jgi:hypothetical protein